MTIRSFLFSNYSWFNFWLIFMMGSFITIEGLAELKISKHPNSLSA